MILNIETSSSLCSISVSEKTSMVYHDAYEGFSHAESLAPMVEKCFKQINKKDLKAIAISKGPGSYTGLRIGTSFAKGLAFALQIPIVSVNTLKLIALDFLSSHELNSKDQIISMIDARRDEVYMQLFDHELSTLCSPTSKILDDSCLFEPSALGAQIYIVGSGAEKAQHLLAPQKSILNFHTKCTAKAENMAMIAHQKLIAQDFESTAYFEPFYLKPVYINNGKAKS